MQGSILFAPGLEDLFLLSYSGPDLMPLAHLTSLARLRMKDYPRVRSLEGIESFRRLAELGVFLARELDDISAVGRAELPMLHTLQLPSCRGIEDLDPIASCSSLRFLDVSECGDIPTLAPLRSLTNLHVLWMYGSTRVTDLDLSPISELPKLEELRMQSRRGYSPLVRQILDEIAHRSSDDEQEPTS